MTKEDWEIVLYYAQHGIKGCAYCDPCPAPVEREAMAEFERWVKRMTATTGEHAEPERASRNQECQDL